MRLHYLPILSVFMFVAGCNEGSVAYYETYETPEVYVPAKPYGPYLQEFNMIDSDGIDSASSNLPLHIDYAVDGGLFEVYWFVDTNVDYRVTVSINDIPSAFGATQLSTELCGPGLSCDVDGFHVCEYTSDFRLGCGIDLFEAERNSVPIDHLFSQVPESLYINLELCDYERRSCVTDSLPVNAH